MVSKRYKNLGGRRKRSIRKYSFHKRNCRSLKGGAVDTDSADDDQGNTAKAIYFISNSPFYNFLSNFAYCSFTEDGNEFISMEQYFMYQKAKLFEESRCVDFIKITTDVKTHGLQQTAANANVILANDQISKSEEQISKLTTDVASQTTLLETLQKAQIKLQEAQIKLQEAKKQVLHHELIDKKNAVSILGKYAQLLGRQVGNYDEMRWLSTRVFHMLKGLRLKFTQYAEFKQKLIDTGDKTLYEANPHDNFWGINFDVVKAQLTENKSKYGKNMLGELLMVVRKELRPS